MLWITSVLLLVFLPTHALASLWTKEDVRHEVCPPLEATTCGHGPLSRRQNEPTITLPGVDAGVQAALALQAGIGNVNITVGNVTVQTGDLILENIKIGDVNVFVSVQLTGQTATIPVQINATSTSIAGSSSIPATATSLTSTTITGSLATIAPSPVLEEGATIVRRQDLPAPTVNGGSGINATLGLNANAGLSVGNVTLTVENVLVSLGSIELKNISIGNVNVAVFLGTPDLGQLVSNVSGALGNVLG